LARQLSYSNAGTAPSVQSAIGNSMTAGRISTLCEMKKQTTSIFLLIGLVLTWILTGCSNSDNKTSSTTTIDTTKVQIPLPPKRNTVATLKEDSRTSFVNRTKEISTSKKANKPFNKLDYNKVIAYDYEGGKGEGGINIITDGKLAPTVKQQKELTQEQVDDLTNYLGANSTYGGNKAACFDPHLGIVFYKDRKIVAHISICLECNYLSSSIKIPATAVKKFKIGDDFEYPAEGFSKLGRQKINSLCKQLNFSHCADTPNSIVDE
jgi:hypothetical protein